MNEIIKAVKEKLNEPQNRLLKEAISGLFTVEWSYDDYEGRDSKAYKRNKNYFIVDKDKTELSKLWLYTFPDHREDYLLEKAWKWMNEEEKEFFRITVKRTSKEFSDKGCFNKNSPPLNLPQKFLAELSDNGKILKHLNKSLKKYKAELKGKGLNTAIIKSARTLKYDKSFVESYKKGINSGYKYWVEKDLPGLDEFYQVLWSTQDQPLDDANKAYAFLTMWQNLSVLFSGSNYFYFFLLNGTIDKIPLKRYALTIHSKEELPTELFNIFSDNLEVCMKDRYLDYQKKKYREELFSSTESPPIEPPIIKDLEYLNNLIIEPTSDSLIGCGNDVKKLLKESFYGFLKIISELAYYTHEGSKVKFKFIIGTEQIWPVISEVISFYKVDSSSLKVFSREIHEKIHKGLYGDPEWIRSVCEANYSLFEIPGAVAHYNCLTKRIHKIIRLKQPDDDERLYEGIIDEEDYNCWILEKIYNITDRKERATLVETAGDGKVKFYGINAEESASLICKWDIGRNKFVVPFEEDDKKSLEYALMLIGLELNDEERHKEKLQRVISKISADMGKGAAIIFCNDEADVIQYLRDMELLPLDWQTSLDLNDPDYILKAALVMDGANLITSNKSIKSRVVMYPFHTQTDADKEVTSAWGLDKFLQHGANGISRHFDSEKIIGDFIGKGSKTHGSSNLATLFLVKNNFSEEKQLVVVSISADGPVKFWPDRILKHIKTV